MAETFRNALSVAGSALGDVYTAPGTLGGSERSLLLGIQVTNTSASSVAVDCQIYDASATAGRYVAKDLSLPAYSAIQLLGATTVLEAADKVRMRGATAAVLDVVLSALEIT